MRNLFLCLCLLVLTTGCAPLYFEKLSVTQEQADQDLAECRMHSIEVSGLGWEAARNMMDACMKSKGYKRVER